MPEYKLHYFNITALGEPIRWLLKYGGVEFEDVRYEFDEWAEVKKNMPFGQMPVLEIDGKQYNQSSAICRYFAKQFGLAGDNELEALEIDGVIDSFTDMRLKVSQTAYEQNKEIQEEGLKKLKEEIIPVYLGKLNELADANGNFLACGKLTWADFYVAALRDYLNWAIKDEDFVDYAGYPNIQAAVEKVIEIPSIKKWIAERPKGMF